MTIIATNEIISATAADQIATIDFSPEDRRSMLDAIEREITSQLPMLAMVNQLYYNTSKNQNPYYGLEDMTFREQFKGSTLFEVNFTFFLIILAAEGEL